MEHYLYIIFSKTKDTFYIGETHEIDRRVVKHNAHTYHRGFTNIANDWELVLDFPCSSKENALYLEKFIKRMKSKKFIIKIIDDPKILSDILMTRK